MRFRLAVAAAVFPLLAMASQASAGAELYLGYGTVQDLGHDFDKYYVTDGSSSLKLGVGYRWGQITIEGALSGANFPRRDVELKTTSLEVQGKYSIPIYKGLEGNFHGGLHKTWFGLERGDSTHDGVGTLVGLGLQYNFVVPWKPVKTGGVWLDYTRHGMTLEGGSYAIEGSFGVLMLGISAGL
jgi:hypothetical protein